jgi:hypothetical protein
LFGDRFASIGPGQGADLLEKRWWDDRPDAVSFVSYGVELRANGSDLTKLKFGEPETAPAFSSADQRAEHQLENGLFAEAVGNDLQPAALFDKQTFKQIGRARGAAVGHRQPQMRNAGFEIVLEAGDRGWQRGCVTRTDAVGELARDRP